MSKSAEKTKDERHTTEALYVAEMQTWIKQNENRLASCDAAILSLQNEIASHAKQIDLIRAGINLEQEQKRIIRRRIAIGKQDLKAYLTKKKPV